MSDFVTPFGSEDLSVTCYREKIRELHVIYLASALRKRVAKATMTSLSKHKPLPPIIYSPTHFLCRKVAI